MAGSRRKNQVSVITYLTVSIDGERVPASADLLPMQAHFQSRLLYRPALADWQHCKRHACAASHQRGTCELVASQPCAEQRFDDFGPVYVVLFIYSLHATLSDENASTPLALLDSGTATDLEPSQQRAHGRTEERANCPSSVTPQPKTTAVPVDTNLQRDMRAPCMAAQRTGEARSQSCVSIPGGVTQ